MGCSLHIRNDNYLFPGMPILFQPTFTFLEQFHKCIPEKDHTFLNFPFSVTAQKWEVMI